MKKLTLLIAAALVAVVALNAQTPANDDCAGLIDLGVAPACPADTFTNVNAGSTNIGFDNNPTCFNSGVAQHDVWFAFTCPDTLFDFRITVTGVGVNPIENPEFAIYRGDCTVDGLAELLCGSADVGENALFIDAIGLTPGVQYFIRVSDYSTTATPNWGDFVLCVAPIPPVVNVDDGGSTLCNGTVYDTGGANDDYGPNEDHTFVICPAQTTGCITFTLTYFNIEDGGFPNPGDVLTFYDGDDVNAPVLASLNGSGFAPPSIAGGGGVCFQVQANSGCLTLQFQSDGQTQLEGWEGTWTCSGEPCEPLETLNVNTVITPDTIVNAVSAPGTTVTVTNINCPTGAYGTFTFPTEDNDLGLQKGLVLTSGAADLAIGPNTLPNAGLINNQPGDDDLNYLSIQSGNGTLSFDACIVELDVFVATNELAFEYVFGSDEYPEYVGTNFNDIFAFLASGPGIAGDPNLSNNALNIALIPGTNAPMQINSVNNLLNWQYYRNNQVGQVLEYDGLTSDSLGVKKSLTARIKTIPCNTYHLKLAVADRGDSSFDSGVFVSEIRGGAPNLEVLFASGIDYFIEDCSGTEDQLLITLSEPAEDTTSYVVTVGGTATLGADYLLSIPNVITFLPGQSQLVFPIVPISDGLQEGTETITIQLSNDFGCGSVVYKTITVDIKDDVEVNVTGGDTLFVCAGNTLQLVAKGALEYFWSPPGAVSNPFIANPTIAPTQDTWLQVTGTINTCVDVDSVLVRIIDPQVETGALGPLNICVGGSVQLQAVNNVNNSGLSWSPSTGLNNANAPNPIAAPTTTTTYTAIIDIAGCSVTDSITVNVDTLFLPTLTTTDTTVCQNYPVQLANVLNTTTNYQWTPATGLNDPNSSGPIALPDQTIVYVLTATSANGYCSQQAAVKVNIIAADVDILDDPYQEICLGTTVPLTAQSSPAGSQVSWSPSFYVTNPSGPTTSTTPDESLTIVAKYVVNGCTVFDSIQLRVDSLPDQTLRREMDKPVYCPGDTVYLISPTYEPASFPDIDITWLPGGNQLTPDSFWNLVILADSTRMFTRIVNNRACVDTVSIEVPVSQIPEIMITATPVPICSGQQVQLNAAVNPPNVSLEWDDQSGQLSCTDCPNPTATLLGTTTFNVTTPDEPCPGQASYTVEVLANPALNLAINPVLCPGESVILNTVVEPGVTYTWTSVPPGFSSSQANPNVTPAVGNITYNVSAQNANCSTTGSVSVIVVNATVNAGSDESICLGETTTLAATTTGADNTDIVRWTPGGFSGTSVQVTPANTTTYTATLEYGPDNRCESTDQVVITVNPPVQLSAIAGSPAPTDSICEGVSITLKVNVVPANANLIWSENGQALSGGAGDSIRVTPNVSAPGSSTFSVLAVDGNGCQATQEIVYNIRRCFAIPNAFTPGNDDVNNDFGIVTFEGSVDVVEFRVFNRWGQQVFEAKGGQTRWDGNIDGTPAVSDVYIYMIRVRFADGKEQTFKGDVTLLR